jgi:hypothetical protein
VVPNERQLVIVASNWGSYLGRLFPHLHLWNIVLCFVYSRLVVPLLIYLVLFKFLFELNMWNSTSAAPWSSSYDSRDRISHQQRTKQRENEVRKF